MLASEGQSATRAQRAFLAILQTTILELALLYVVPGRVPLPTTAAQQHECTACLAAMRLS